MNGNAPRRYKVLTGTTEKLVLFTLWLAIALTRPQWSVQLVLLVSGIAFFKSAAGKAPNRSKSFLISLSFIVAGTIGLIVVTGHHPFDARLQFRFAGLWWGITHDSVRHAAGTALKAINAMLAVQFAIHRFSFAEALAVARFVRLPNVFLELVLLSYRYLFSVKQCANEVMTAQQQRLGYCGFRTSLRSCSLLLSSVFVKSLRFSLQNYQAMMLRGYNGAVYQPHQWIKSSTSTLALILFCAVAIICFSYIRF